MAITIHSLFVYPIKSCAGIALRRAAITPTGLRYDRQWMVVTEDKGSFITQRKKPMLSQVSVSVPLHLLEALDDDAAASSGDVMTVQAPGMSKLEVPLQLPEDRASRIKHAKVWEWQGNTLDEGTECAAWFSDYLQMPVRLVRYLGRDLGPEEEGVHRPLTEEFATGETAFADGFPLLLATEESRQAMEVHAGVQLSMSRFRPNLVVSGGKAFEEDSWQSLEAKSSCNHGPSSLFLDSVKPCSRCTVTRVDPSSGEVGKHPFPSLQALRSGSKLAADGKEPFLTRDDWKRMMFFGWNIVPRASGVLTVGDGVSVLERRSGNEGGWLSTCMPS